MKGPAGMPGFPGMKGHRVSTVSKLTLKLFHLAMFIYLANFIGQLSVCQKRLIPTSSLFLRFLNLSTLLTKSTTYFT